MLADGSWIFVLEGLLALLLAVLIVWWTLPSKRDRSAPIEPGKDEKHATHGDSGNSSARASDAGKSKS